MATSFSWRRARTGAGWNVVAVVLLLIALGVVIFGSWATAQAAIAGDTAGTLLRFGFAILLGAYYFALSAMARGATLRAPF